MELKFHHMALKTANLEKSVAFYSALGLKESLRWGQGEREIVLMELPGGGRLELFANGGDQYPVEGKYVHFAMESHDIEGDYAHALSIGAQPMTPPKYVDLESSPERATFHLAFVYGPDGEQLEFIEVLPLGTRRA